MGQAQAPGVPAELIAELRSDLVSRRLESGMARLNSCQGVIEALHRSQERAAVFLSCIAQ